MSIIELKSEIYQWLDEVEDGNILQAIHLILAKEVKNQPKDFWDELSEASKISIEKGLKDLREGKSEDFWELVKKYQ
jgi:hypothetical protein